MKHAKFLFSKRIPDARFNVHLCVMQNLNPVRIENTIDLMSNSVADKDHKSSFAHIRMAMRMNVN